MAPPRPTDPDERLFDEYYASVPDRDLQAVPWARGAPNQFVADWLDQARPPSRPHHHALVIGSGLGDDAESLAGRGWDVTAFDSSVHAIEWTRRRFPDSHVDYQVASLFALPDSWREAFDLVVEVHTIQALPVTRRQAMIEQIASTVAPGGTLLVVTFRMDPDDLRHGRPWPLTTHEIDSIAQHGLEATNRIVARNHPDRTRVTFERRRDS